MVLNKNKKDFLDQVCNISKIIQGLLCPEISNNTKELTSKKSIRMKRVKSLEMILEVKI